MTCSGGFPVGAELTPGGVHFRVWAPRRHCVEVVIEGDRLRIVPLEQDGSGYFAGLAEGAEAGGRYKYRLDSGDSFPPIQCPAFNRRVHVLCFRDSGSQCVRMDRNSLVARRDVGRPGYLRNAHRYFYQGGYLEERRAGAAAPGRNRRHGVGGYAGGGISGTIWMGIRRR